MNAKKILAPTDLSELSRTGLRYALGLGKSEGAEIIVYHVIGPSEDWLDRHDDFYSPGRSREKYQAALARFVGMTCADLLPQISIRCEVDFGVPYEKIVEKAAEETADLIVMSTHGWSGLFHVLIGSVTEKVVRLASCPVLSIHPPEESTSPTAAL